MQKLSRHVLYQPPNFAFKMILFLFIFQTLKIEVSLLIDDEVTEYDSLM